MKKYVMTLGLMLGMLSLTGCQKDIDNSTNIEGAEQQITRTITVEGEWEGDTRSEYVEGEGVQLTGKEVLTVYYGDAQYQANDEATDSKLAKTKAEPSGEGDFLYTFSHSAISGATAYDYYFIMPNTTTNNMQSKGHRPMVYLNTIQAPKANTFDAAQDYLVGQPLLNQSEAATSSTVRFKRMFAPLRMMVKNGGALLEGEKILYATISQSATCTAKNPLVGSAYFRFSPGNDAPEKSDAYEDARIRNFLSTGYGNKVTAFYPTGLEAAGEGYPVWYIINPSNTDNDTPTTISGDMTVTLVTDQRMLSRTVTLANPMEFAANKLNQFSITFGDDVDVVAGQAVTTTFANYNSLEDLEQEGWEFLHSNYNNKSIEIANSETNAGKITLPTTAGKKITKIIVLPSLYHPNNSNLNNFQLHAGDTTVESFNFNAQNMLTSADNMYGYLVIDVPVEYQTAKLALVKPTTDKAKCSIRAITLIYEDSTAPAASVEFVSADFEELTFNVEMVNAEKYYYLCQPSSEKAPTAEEVVSNGTETTATKLTITGLNEATAYTLYVVAVKGDAKSPVASAEGKTKSSATDYYELYNTNGFVTIGDYTFTKEDWGDATLVTTDKLTTKNLTSGGIVFVEQGNADFTTESNLQLGKNLTLIGRYNNQQPTINTKKLQLTGGCSYNFVNMRITNGTTTDNFFTTDNGSVVDPISSIIIKDCTLEPFKHVISVNKYAVKSCIIDNCVIKLNNTFGVFIVANDNIEPYTNLFEFLKVTNCVIYSESEIQSYLIGANSIKRNMPNVTIEFTYNTIYNIYRNPYINLYNAKQVDVEYNVAYSSETGNDKSFVSVTNAVETNVGPYIVSNNYGYTVGKKFISNHSKCVVEITEENNTYVSNEESRIPFSSANASIGYFPVNTTVVTNGAGASYETKLWYNWGE